MDANTTPSAPAGWFLSDHPTEGALVVPLGHTEADVVRDLADGWEPLRLTRVNTSTGRATARPQQGGPARPVVYSGRAGGGWRQGGWWVRFATPRTPEPAPVDEAAETAHAAAQMAPHRSQQATGSSFMAPGDTDEPTECDHGDGTPRCSSCPTLAERNAAVRAAADAADQAATEAAQQAQDEDEEAEWEQHLAQLIAGRRPVRPAWLYGPAAGTEGEVTYVDDEDAEPLPDDPRRAAQTADDSHLGVGPRPSLSVFESAVIAAGAALDRHAERACSACAAEAEGRGWCAVWTGLVRRSTDAADALRGQLAVAR